MNKIINVRKDESKGEICIYMNDDLITKFEINKNKINGKELLEKMSVNFGDVFILSEHGIDESSKVIDDVVVINTHVFLNKVITRINDVLEEIQNSEKKDS